MSAELLQDPLVSSEGFDLLGEEEVVARGVDPAEPVVETRALRKREKRCLGGHDRRELLQGRGEDSTPGALGGILDHDRVAPLTDDEVLVRVDRVGPAEHEEDAGSDGREAHRAKQRVLAESGAGRGRPRPDQARDQEQRGRHRQHEPVVEEARVEHHLAEKSQRQNRPERERRPAHHRLALASVTEADPRERRAGEEGGEGQRPGDLHPRDRVREAGERAEDQQAERHRGGRPWDGRAPEQKVGRQAGDREAHHAAEDPRSEPEVARRVVEAEPHPVEGVGHDPRPQVEPVSEDAVPGEGGGHLQREQDEECRDREQA